MSNCIQPNCTGTIDDGYCDVCGMAAAKSSTAKSSAVPIQQNTTNHPLGTGWPSQRSGRATAPTSTAQTSGSGLTSRSRGSRRSTGTVARSSRRQLGLGLVSIPELPSKQPEQSILTDTKVPDSKRICGKCDNPLRRDQGFCSQCGQKYSFLPTLQAGDVVAGQYEVKGPMAYGGLGWIYLGYDRVLNRYVVLKGLLNSEDAASAAVAVAERQFLAAVKHANIVSIYNFVNHGTEGFIIMEYVGGQTLKEIRKTRGPLPVAEAIAYIHRILASFSYLHQQGLVYCDFKPDNIMLEDGDVKLIDLGGVRREADLDGDIYGTIGYTAPEAGEGPTIVSDLFTIGRTLAVLLTNIPQFTKEFQYRLPSPADVELFAQEESLYRFLLKSTAENPDDRFQSADEMAQQLLGVLREVVARQTGQPQTTNSQFFTGDALPLTAQNPLEIVGMDLAQLPNPTLPNDDPAFTELVKIIGLRDLSQQLKSLEALLLQYPASRATKFKIVETIQNMFLMAVSSNFLSQADQILVELEQEDLWDWRVPWYRGRTLMLKRQFGQAKQSFEQVCFDLPGELAPKFALAMASEASQEYVIAAKYYNNVLSTDLSYPSAAFGLARCLMHQGQRSPAVTALQKVPQTSTLHNHAKVAITRILVETKQGIPAVQDIQTAANLVKTISLDLMDQNRLKRQVMENALHLLQAKQITPNGIALFDQPFEEVKLRSGLESVLREMARLSTGEEKTRLVEEANRVRPRTLF